MSSTSTSTTTTTSLPPSVKNAIDKYTQAGKAGGSTAVSDNNKSSASSAPIAWDGKRDSNARKATRDNFAGPGRTVGAVTSTDSSASTTSTSQSSAATPLPVVKRADATTAASAIPISNIRPSQTAQTFQRSEWAGTGDLDGADNIAARFKTATDVIRKLAKERSKSLKSTSRPSPDSLTTLQKQEAFTDGFVDDAAYVWDLASNSAAFKKRLPSVMRSGRRAKLDGYHRSVELESDYRTSLDQSQAFKDTGLKDDQKKKMSDILWRNPTTSLLIMEKMLERERRQEETEPTGSVSERLSSYCPSGFVFGDGGYEQETSQIQANISAEIASRPPASRTARPDKLSTLSGHELVTAIAELGWTISEKHEMEVNDICAWGREIPALVAKFEADHRTANKIDKSVPLDVETTASITDNVKSLVYSHLKFKEGWDLEDVESLMSMWSVKDLTALNMGLRSIPKHATSKVERPIKKSTAALKQAEQQLSVYDDPYKSSSSVSARWL